VNAPGVGVIQRYPIKLQASPTVSKFDFAAAVASSRWAASQLAGAGVVPIGFLSYRIGGCRSVSAHNPSSTLLSILFDNKPLLFEPS